MHKITYIQIQCEGFVTCKNKIVQDSQFFVGNIRDAQREFNFFCLEMTIEGERIWWLLGIHLFWGDDIQVSIRKQDLAWNLRDLQSYELSALTASTFFIFADIEAKKWNFLAIYGVKRREMSYAPINTE